MRRIAVLLAFTSAAQAAEPPALGRLFHTPEERRALDQERKAADRESRRKEGRVTLNGVVYRSGGDTTVWVNQQMQHHEGQLRPQPSGQIRMADGKSLRVGETADRNKHQDLLESGAIRVTPAR